MKGWGVGTLLLSIAFFSVAIWLPNYLSQKLSDGIDDTITITATNQANGDSNYEEWIDPTNSDSTPVYYNAYFYSCTNAPLVLAGTKPNFVEMGPYVYLKNTFKHTVTFFTNLYGQDEVSFQRQTDYIYQPSMSCAGCSETDNVTNLNLAFWGLKGPSIGQLFYPYDAYGASADYLRMFVTKQVNQWMFGWADPVIAGLHASYSHCFTPVGKPCIPPQVYGVVGPNQEDYDPLQVPDTLFVGDKPYQQMIRQYDAFEGETYLVTGTFNPFGAGGNGSITTAPTWATPDANRVGGTDGTQFARNIQDGQTVGTYVNQLRRVVTLGNIDNEHVTLKGIDTCKFTIPTPFLLNASGNPLSSAYYSFYYNGVANLTATGDPDFYVSKPHFLDSDPEPLAAITGVTAPDPDLHDTFLLVEPISGATMQAAKRLQLNIRVVPIITAYVDGTGPHAQSWFPGLPNGGTLFPVYWAEEVAVISDSDASTFKTKVYGTQRAASGIEIAGEVIGAAMAVITVVLFWISAHKTAPTGQTDKSVPL